MDAANLYFWVSLLGLAFTGAALVRARNLGPALPVYFFAGWLTSELALFHIAWQAVATVLFAANGALAETRGVVGLLLTFVSWAGLLVSHHRSLAAPREFERALEEGLGEKYRDEIPAERAALLRDEIPFGVVSRPFSFVRPGVERSNGIAYAADGVRTTLDVFRPQGAQGPRPTLLQIHGGAWTIGEKEQQGQPLMNHLAERGWVCVAINYRLGPAARFPDMLVDCKRALHWMRTEGLAYGVDPDFIAVTGGSAGGHLTSLTALTANDKSLQPGFEDTDTSVQAAVPFYGVFDFLDQKGQGANISKAGFLDKYVMPSPAARSPELWHLASPVSQVNDAAPPFFVIHGTHDSLAIVEDARFFVQDLRAVSQQPVVYAELYGAQHAFEVFHTVRSVAAVNAASAFLEWAHARHQRS